MAWIGFAGVCAGLVFGPMLIVELHYRWQLREINRGRWRKYRR